MVTNEQLAGRGLPVRLMHRFAADSGYVVRGGTVGLVAFVLLAIGFAAGAGLVIVGAGLPVLAATLEAARRFADDERRRIGTVLGVRPAAAHHRRAPAEVSWIRRLLIVLGDGQSWSDAVHGLLRAVPGIAGLALLVTWLAGAVAGLTAPLWRLLLPSGVQTIGDLLFAGGGAMPIVADVLTGAVFALTLGPLARGIAVSNALFARAMLQPVHGSGR
jgi:hypothetical protein